MEYRANRVSNLLAMLNGLWDYDPMSVGPVNLMPEPNGEENPHAELVAAISKCRKEDVISDAEEKTLLELMGSDALAFNSQPMPERCTLVDSIKAIQSEMEQRSMKKALKKALKNLLADMAKDEVDAKSDIESE